VERLLREARLVTLNAYEPAIVYNTQGNEYLVVWRGDDNTAPLVDDELEIFGQRLSAATGAAVGANDFRISDMGPDGDTLYAARRPAVAYLAQSNEYLVVWEGDDNTPPLVESESEIFGQHLNGATGAEAGTNDFRLSDMGPDGTPATRRSGLRSPPTARTASTWSCGGETTTHRRSSTRSSRSSASGSPPARRHRSCSPRSPLRQRGKGCSSTGEPAARPG
jgi:hypothetical protein